MEIVKRIFKEFWLPTIFALAWTIYSYPELAKWSLLTLGKFSAAFFFTSWLLSQYFRIKKQTQTEKSLGTIEGRLENLLNDIEISTNELSAQITGGNSACNVVFHRGPDNGQCFLVAHVGSNPIFGVSIRIVDLDRFNDAASKGLISNRTLYEHNINVTSLYPGVATESVRTNLGTANANIRANIFSVALNGRYFQYIRQSVRDAQLHVATRIEVNGALVFEQLRGYSTEELQSDAEWMRLGDLPKVVNFRAE